MGESAKIQRGAILRALALLQEAYEVRRSGECPEVKAAMAELESLESCLDFIAEMPENLAESCAAHSARQALNGEW